MSWLLVEAQCITIVLLEGGSMSMNALLAKVTAYYIQKQYQKNSYFYATVIVLSKTPLVDRNAGVVRP